MKYALVRHENQPSKKNYAFAIPDELVQYAMPGAKVTMDTFYGPECGILMTGAMEASEDDIRFTNPKAVFPLREITAIEWSAPWESVKIPKRFQNAPPKPEKIFKRLKELEFLGRFDTNINIDSNSTLLDGYSAYLVCRMYNMPVPIKVFHKEETDADELPF